MKQRLQVLLLRKPESDNGIALLSTSMQADPGFVDFRRIAEFEFARLEARG
ncbi:hypothetical protein [Pseudomonas sp. NBRC 100443]|uniref:hypothetical protein n=1 Tax=Pseudomonas sp. NBRC 100443 TaxID=1113665 RepID=UPI002553EB67|nr:hypothetical protein [Pseudomonas sp. NBRC 100443]